MAKKIKILKTASDKALKSINTYTKNLNKGTEQSYAAANKAIDDIVKYLNKNGTVSKTKTRTKKAKVAYNAAVQKYLDIAATKKQRVANSYNARAAGAAAGMIKNQTFSGPGASEKADTAAAIFMDKTYDKLNIVNASEAVIALTESGYNLDDIWDILKHIERNSDFSTPDEMIKYTSEDDVSMFISNLTNIHDIDPTIPTEDAIMLADQMTGYGLDDTEQVIAEYWEDNY